MDESLAEIQLACPGNAAAIEFVFQPNEIKKQAGEVLARKNLPGLFLY